MIDSDVAIIGGGIVGLATAYNFLKKKPGLKIVVLEKESTVGFHQTSRNSGVIHSGIYYKPGSKKALNCILGYRKLLEFCQEEGIPFELCGKIIVATCEAELPLLAEIHRRGLANGLQGLKEISREEIRELEPYCSGIRGIHVPSTGIIQYGAVAKSLAKRIGEMGGEIHTLSAVEAIRSRDGKNEIVTRSGIFRAQRIINCAGLHSDRISKMSGSEDTVRIIPFRGEYFVLRPEASHLVRNLIYPVPNPQFPFLGVHFTRMMGGGVEIGPNAVLALKREGYRKFDFSLRDFTETLVWPGFGQVVSKYWREGMYEVYRSFSKRAFLRAAQKLIPELTLKDMSVGGAGVRAQACDRYGSLLDDFKILAASGVTNVLNAPSPAATSSLSIGQMICEEALAEDSAVFAEQPHI